MIYNGHFPFQVFIIIFNFIQINIDTGSNPIYFYDSTAIGVGLKWNQTSNSKIFVTFNATHKTDSAKNILSTTSNSTKIGFYYPLI